LSDVVEKDDAESGCQQSDDQFDVRCLWQSH
jgi:hypothetical protein